MSRIAEELAKLTVEQRAAIEQRLLAQRAARGSRASISRVQDRTRVPLSYGQARLWFLDRLQPGNPFYNMPAAFRIEGQVPVAALAAALKALLDRHEVLRTVFATESGVPYQVVQDAPEAPLNVVDLRDVPAAEREARMHVVVEGEVLRPFDLARGPMLRVLLVQLDEADHVLVLTVHHIAADGWSVQILTRELTVLLRAQLEGRSEALPALPIQYADYAQWQRQRLAGDVLAAQLAYWRGRLAGPLPGLELALERPRPPVPTHRGGGCTTYLEPALTAAVHDLGRKYESTLFATALSVFQLLLHRLSGQGDILVGVPVAGRTHPELEGLIGFFVNTLPMRARPTPEMTFGQLLRQVRQTALEAFDHQELPFEKIVEELNPERNLSRPDIFQAMFILQNNETAEAAVPGLRIRPIELAAATARFDLRLAITEVDGQLRCDLHYSTDLFSAERAAHIMDQYALLVRQVTANPDLSLSRYSLVTERARALLPEPRQPLPGAPLRPVLERIAARAAEHPAQPALVQGERSLTYEALYRRYRALAGQLVRAGVQPGDVVAIHGRRGIELVTAFLAVLQCRAIAMPVDQDLPLLRKQTMLEEGGAWLVLSVAAVEPELATGRAVHLLDLDTGLLAASGEGATPVDAALPAPEPDDAAYLFFTSGTTGRPKGIVGIHRGLTHFIDWHRTELGIAVGDRLSQLAAPSFDAMLKDVFPALTAGATLAIPPFAPFEDPRRLLAWLDAERVTVAQTVPSVVATWLSVRPDSAISLASLRTLTLAGEPLQATLLAGWHAAFPACPAEIVNLYGPTETTILKSYYRVPREPRAGVQPLGTPIPGAQIFVIGAGGELCGIGEPGEIVIRTPFGTRGYLRPPPERSPFVPNPFTGDPADIVYRTGDLGVVDADGLLHIRGRLDDEVKVRGVRVNPSEVASVLSTHPGVRASYVGRWVVDGDTRLAAYVVPRDGATPSPAALRAHLEARLPAAMVPAAFVTVPALPLLPNGKVDRRALPSPEPDARTRVYEPPRTPTEELLAGIWQHVLDVDRVGVNESFFELGGHSLLAIQVLARIRTAFGVDLPVRELFTAPTVAALAARIDEGTRGGGQRRLPPLVPGKGQEPAPLTAAQRRLWFLDRLEPGNPAYNMSGAVRLRRAVDPDTLQRCFVEIVRRHASLRTTFAIRGEEPVQVVHDEPRLDFRSIELGGVPEALRLEQARKHYLDQVGRSFDLSAGPLLRVSLMRLAEDDVIVALVLHHIIADAWSVGLLIRELESLWPAFSRGEPSPLPPLPVQVADVARWQQQWLSSELVAQQLAYWRERLGGSLPVLDLPVDNPRPAVVSYAGATIEFELDAALTPRVHALSRSQGVTPFMTMLAGFLALLQRYAGQEDIVVGSDIATRTLPELEPLIGFFVNTLVLRTDLSGSPSFLELLARVRETVLDAYAHQDIPFEQVVDEVAPQRDLARSPLFQVMFRMRRGQVPALSTHDPAFDSDPFGDVAQFSKFDLTMAVDENDGVLCGELEYATALFSSQRMERLIEHYEALLGALLSNPEAPIAQHSMMAASERAILPDPARPLERPPQPQPLALVRAAAERHAVRVAIRHGAHSYSYEQLAAAVDAIRAGLLAAGHAPGDVVAVHGGKGPAAIAALLGVVDAGGVVLPLDAVLPSARKETLLAAAGARRVVAVGTALDTIGAQLPCLRVPDSIEALAQARHEGDAARAQARAGEDPAYIFFTSGTTGQPKGVLGCHRSITHFVSWEAATLGVGEDDRVAQLTTLSFDAVLRDIFLPLGRGGTMCIPAPDQMSDPAALLTWLTQERVTVIHTVPSVIASWIAAGGSEPDSLAALRLLCLAGEPLQGALVTRFRERFPACRAEIVNFYGPTETTMIRSYYRVPEAPAPMVQPVGRPLDHTQLLVLAAGNRVCATGELGEIVIRTAFGTLGYLDGGTDAGGFRRNPFTDHPDDHVYYSGDLGRFLPDGQVAIAGRKDDQVKIFGVRVSPAEVAAVLERHPGVAACAVLPRRGQGEQVQLVAFVVPADVVELDALRDFLAERLPPAMVPAELAFVEAIPLLPNGKVDRAALLALEQSTPEPTFAAPQTQTERDLAALWSHLLGLDAVGRSDDFFKLGGHSLLATLMLTRIRQRFEVDLPLRIFFRASTLGEVAAHIDALRAERAKQQQPALVPIQPGGTQTPLFCLHPIGGSVLCYRELAAAVGKDQPVYGLEARGVESDQSPRTDVAEMARAYLEEIRAQQPHGPYRLLGWSFGGLVAFEIARALRDGGAEVAPIVLLDSHPPGALAYGPEVLDDRTLLQAFLGDLSGMRRTGAGGMDRARAAALIDQLATLPREQAIEQIVRTLVDLGLVDMHLGAAQLRRQLDVFAANQRAASGYRPPPSDVEALLFRSTDLDGREQLPSVEGWRAVCKRGLDVVELAANHYTMLSSPAIDTIARRLLIPGVPLT